MSEEEPPKQKAAKTNPGPWHSALWDHLEEIRQLRHQRKKWAEISRHLKEKRKIDISYRAIRNFFIRSRKRNRKVPVGFENTILSGVKPPQDTPAPSPEIHFKRTPKISYAEHKAQREREEQAARSRPPETKIFDE